MKLALSGASGFIGRHVLSELARQGIKPVVILRPDADAPDFLCQYRMVRIDIANTGPDAYAQLGCPDVLIHLAWGGLPNYRSLHHFERELPAHYAFLKGLVVAGLPHLVVSGTCFEYGMQSGPLGEDLPTAPANPYGLAKDSLRRQLEQLRRLHPFSMVWARLFYLYGQAQALGSLLPLLRRAVERGDTVFPMSGGQQLRDYLDVAEAARQLVALARGARDVGVVNVCSGQPISVRSLVEGWIEEHAWSITPALGCHPYPEHEPMAFWGDRSKFDRLQARAESERAPSRPHPHPLSTLPKR